MRYKTDENKLTEKQKLWADAYIASTMDAEYALEAAGYRFASSNDAKNRTNKKKQINELQSNPNIKRYLSGEWGKLEKDSIEYKHYVMEKLKQFVEKGSENVAIKALELMGKTQAMFTDKQVYEGTEDPSLIARSAFEARKKTMKLIKKEDKDVTTEEAATN